MEEVSTEPPSEETARDRQRVQPSPSATPAEAATEAAVRASADAMPQQKLDKVQPAVDQPPTAPPPAGLAQIIPHPLMGGGLVNSKEARVEGQQQSRVSGSTFA